MSAVTGEVGDAISRLDLREAADLLTKVEFEFPTEAKELWEQDDGLPLPENPDFASEAARFVTVHPIPDFDTLPGFDTSLRPYSTQASIQAPDQRSQGLWDIGNTASRQLKSLAYLAGGKKEARNDLFFRMAVLAKKYKSEVANLCVAQARWMQWGLPIHTGHRRAPDYAFFAATSGLSVTGGLLRKSAEKGSVTYEVATQWLRTGLGQFATYSEKGDNSQRRAAAALLDCVDAKAESLEIHGTAQEFLEQLNTERLDMREVARYVTSSDWEGAREAYVEALAERFSAKRGWPEMQCEKLDATTADIPEADDICRNIFILRAHMHRRYDYGEKVDWAKVIDNDIESRVWMNHHPWMGTLNDAYRETGDDKYVKHLCRLFNSWYESSPPTFERSSAQWRTLEVGGRTSQRWGTSLISLAEHPIFKHESLFNMARSMLEHAKYLSMYAARGGNWLQVESSGLACVALFFPEFVLSPVFYEVAMNRLAWVNAAAFLPDGFQSECSTFYHYFPLGRIANVLLLAKLVGAPIPYSLMKQYEHGAHALAHITYPDGTLPQLSDCNPWQFIPAEVFKAAFEVTGREDMRWLATDGREGTPPLQTSYDFTHAGYCVMRGKWGPDAQMLVFDAGYFGAGHQHEDKLNFVYYAGDRELIGDPGIYSYKHDEFEPYWRGSWSHNTIVIDGLTQHRRLGPPEDIPDSDRRFVMGEDFDFAVGWYRRAYSPRTGRDGDRAAAIRNVQHQRCIFHVKSRYAIICDRVLGQGEHQIDILFHPAPVVTGEGMNRTARAVKLEVRPDGVVVTRERDHANVAILPAQSNSLEVLNLIGQKNPVRGWYALYGIIPSHDIVYRCSAELPLHFETVVQPLAARETEPMQVKSRQVDGEKGKACAALSCGDDLFLISYDGPADMACGDVRFHGTALLLSFDQRGSLVRAYMVDGKLLTIGDRQVFSTETPTPARSLELR